MKDTMTPTEAFIFRLKHESEIKAITSAMIISTALLVLVMLVLSPILIPLWILEKSINGVRNVWAWFFPKPEVDETLMKVRVQFQKARAARK
jgi:hypothetical protein